MQLAGDFPSFVHQADMAAYPKKYNGTHVSANLRKFSCKPSIAYFPLFSKQNCTFWEKDGCAMPSGICAGIRRRIPTPADDPVMLRCCLQAVFFAQKKRGSPLVAFLALCCEFVHQRLVLPCLAFIIMDDKNQRPCSIQAEYAEQ